MLEDYTAVIICGGMVGGERDQEERGGKRENLYLQSCIIENNKNIFLKKEMRSKILSEHRRE